MQNLVSRLAAAICLSAFAAGASFAAGGSEATLASAVAAPKQVVIDGKVWTCEGAKCTAGNSGRSQPAPRECARVAKELGELTAYRQGDKVLSAEQLRACNS